MRLLAVVSFVTASVFGQSPVLPVLERKEIGPQDLARSANALIELGEERACGVLVSRVTNFAHTKGFCGDERIGWLCRLIFDPSDKVVPATRAMSPGGPVVRRTPRMADGRYPVRRPLFGGLALPHRSMPITSWPRYPVAVQDGVPFVLAEGYTLAGLPEDPRKYIAHCRKHGRFRTQLYRVPDRATAERALEALFASSRWTAIRWKFVGKGERYTISESWRKKSLREQVERAPK